MRSSNDKFDPFNEPGLYVVLVVVVMVILACCLLKFAG